MSSPSTIPSRIRHTRLLGLMLLAGLVLLGLAWELWLAPLRPGGSWWALKVLPLCTAWIGLTKYRMYTYRWLSMLIWLYVAEGLVRAPTETGWSQYLALLQVILSVLLFTVCALHIRWRFKSSHSAPLPSS
jgi:uncharacterized membrane protein